jgi:hypothetical protein
MQPADVSPFKLNTFNHFPFWRLCLAVAVPPSRGLLLTPLGVRYRSVHLAH